MMIQVRKRFLVILIMISLICIPTQINAEVTEDTINYDEYFKDVMEMLTQSYLYKNEMTEKELFEAAMEGIFSTLDPYSKFMTLEEFDQFSNSITPNYVGIGVKIQTFGKTHYVMEVYEGSPAELAGIKAGDYFKNVENTEASQVKIEELVKLILGEAGTEVNITLVRGKEAYSTRMIRAAIVPQSADLVELGTLTKGLTDTQSSQMAYVKVSTFSTTVAQEFETIYQQLQKDGVKYLILDLRDNGGGYVQTAVALAQLIIPKGKIVQFENAEGEGMIYESTLQTVPFKIYALINENSASATEFVAGALQDSKAGILIGEKTYGKGVAQYLYPFKEKYAIKLTMEEFFTRDHNPVNEIGIQPDVEIEIPDYLSKTDKYRLYDEKDEVIVIEKILKHLGYLVDEPDQIYDLKTFQAIKKFQTDFGGYSYGVCDFGTQDALNTALQKSIWANDIQLEKAVSLILDEIEKK